MSSDPEREKLLELQVEKGEYEPLLDLWKKGGESDPIALEYASRAAVRRVALCVTRGDFSTLMTITRHEDLPEYPKRQARLGIIPAVKNAIKIYPGFDYFEGLEKISCTGMFPEELRKEAGFLAVTGYQRSDSHQRLIEMACGWSYPEDVRSKAQEALAEVIKRLLQQNADSLNHEEWLGILEDRRYPEKIRQWALQNAEKKVNYALQRYTEDRNFPALLRMSAETRLIPAARETAGCRAVEGFQAQGALENILEIIADRHFPETVRIYAQDRLAETASKAIQKAAEMQNSADLVRISLNPSIDPATRETAGRQANLLFAAKLDRHSLNRVKLDEKRLPKIREHADLMLIQLCAEKGECEHLFALHDNLQLPDNIRKAAWEALPQALEIMIKNCSKTGAPAGLLSLLSDRRISMEVKSRLGNAAVDLCIQKKDRDRLLEISQNPSLGDQVRVRSGCAAMEMLQKGNETVILKEISMTPGYPAAVIQAAKEALRQCAENNIVQLFKAKEAIKLQVLAQQPDLDESIRIRAGLSAILLFAEKPVAGWTYLSCMAQDSSLPALVSKAAEEAIRNSSPAGPEKKS